MVGQHGYVGQLSGRLDHGIAGQLFGAALPGKEEGSQDCGRGARRLQSPFSAEGSGWAYARIRWSHHLGIASQLVANAQRVAVYYLRKRLVDHAYVARAVGR